MFRLAFNRSNATMHNQPWLNQSWRNGNAHRYNHCSYQRGCGHNE